MSSYNYISKAPCGEDRFSRQVHKKLAQQIARALIDPKQCNMIGIEGGWGTGKSNLIALIEADIRDNKHPCVFFTYDAWKHQNDLPRRSILEELIRRITQSSALNEVDKRRWREKLKELMSKRQEVTTKTIPKISMGILVLSLVVMLSPIFSNIGAQISDVYGVRWGVLLSILPFFLGIVYLVASWLKSKDKDLKTFINRLGCLYQEGSTEKTLHEEIFSEEPSSTQFKQWMKDLNGSLRSPLIIVFDNMDRLPAVKVQEFWAAILSFFADEKYSQIRVIVPFDREQIISAFRSEDNTTKRVANTESTGYNISGGYCYGNDFINKTFDVIYRMAPPILSNWKIFLSNLWKEAFGQELPLDSSVTQIFDLLSPSRTPRAIVSFVNDCVTIREMCDASIEDEYIALFSIGKQHLILQPDKELLSLSFIEPLAYKYRNEVTSRKLSALYYQLPEDEAIELVYVDQLRRELETGTSTLLQTLVSQSIFTEILEHAIAKVSHVENAALAFAKVEGSSLIASVFWAQLILKAKDEEISPQEYQINLLKNGSKDVSRQYLESIVKSIYAQCDSKHNTERNKVDSFDAVQFYLCIHKLETALQEFKHLTPWPLLHNQSTTADAFTSFVNVAKESYVKYLIHCQVQDIDSYISVLPIEDLKDMQVVKYLPSNMRNELPQYKEALKTHINSFSDFAEAEVLMSRWVELGIVEKDLMTDSVVDDLFSNAKEHSILYYCCICMCLASGKPDSYPSIKRVLETRNDNLVEKLSQYIQLFVTYEDLLLMYQDMSTYTLYKSLVCHLISTHTGKVMSIERILPLYKNISSSLEVTIKELLIDLNRWSKSLERAITEVNLSSIPGEFFEDTKEMKDLEIVSHCQNVARKYLQTVELDEWEEHFSKESYEYKLLMSLKCDCPNAYEAFKKTMITELEKDSLRLSSDVFKNLVSLFGEQKKQWSSVFQNARERYGEIGEITTDVFKRYGVALIEKGDLSKNSNAIRTILPTRLLTDSETLNILVEKRDKVAHILDSAEPEYRQEFCDMALSIYKSKLENNSIDEVLPLISALKINLPAEDSEDMNQR